VKEIFAAILLAFLLLAPAWRGECYVAIKHKSVPLAVGRLSLPAEIRLTEFDFNSFLQSENVQKILTGDKFKQTVQEIKTLPNGAFLAEAVEFIASPAGQKLLSKLSMYQASLYDGSSYQMVFLLAMRESDELEKVIPGFFQKKLTEEKKATLLLSYVLARSVIEEALPLQKDAMADKSRVRKITPGEGGANCLTLLEWPQPEFFTIQGRPAVETSLRAAGLGGDSFFAVYGKAYFFGINKKPSFLAFFSPDASRAFWTKIMDKAMYESFKPTKKKEVLR
jgi:hypothetical protein